MPLHLHQLQVQMLWELVSLLFYLLHQALARKRNEIVWHQLHAQEQAQSHAVTTILRLPWELSLQWRNLTSNACSLHRIWPNHIFHVSRALPSPGGASASFFQSLPFFWPLCIGIDVTFVRTNILEVVVDRPLFFFLCSAHTVLLPRVHSWGGLIKRRSVKISHGKKKDKTLKNLFSGLNDHDNSTKAARGQRGSNRPDRFLQLAMVRQVGRS